LAELFHPLAEWNLVLRLPRPHYWWGHPKPPRRAPVPSAPPWSETRSAALSAPARGMAGSATHGRRSWVVGRPGWPHWDHHIPPPRPGPWYQPGGYP